MNKRLKIIIIVLCCIILAVLAKNSIARVAVSTSVRAMTGLKVGMRRMHVGLIRTLIDIKGLKLFNPAGFPEALMADMPEIYVDYDLGAFLARKVHLERLRINLREFVVIKNEKGEVNLNSLKSVKAKKTKEKEKKPAQAEKKDAFKIDVLELKIGKVIYKDYSRGAPPSVAEFNVNIDERYENITNPEKLANVILVKALVNTTIANLANFDLGLLKGEVADLLKSATRIAGETADKALEKTKIKKILPFGKE